MIGFACERARARLRDLPVPCSYWRDQPRLLWLDNPSGVSLVVAGGDSALDHRGRASCRLRTSLASRQTGFGGGNAERMKIANRWMLALAVCCLAANWKTAEPGWIYQFPRDHHVHPDFKTEWCGISRAT